MAVNKKLKALYMGFFDGIETWTANRISDIQEIASLNKNRDKSFKLTKEQKKEIRDFWRPYCRVSTRWCGYYVAKNGRFDPRYVPNDLFFTKIDQHFNARKLGYGFNDKNYYSLLFPDIKQPKTLVRKIDKLLFDESYGLISLDEAMNIVSKEDEVILKPSQESGSGRGIRFLKTDNADDMDELNKLLSDKKEKNYIVQAIVKQHPDIAKIHPTSLNTIRICTLLLDDGVHVLSSVLRVGMNSSRVDNGTADGISAGIRNGKLDEYAYNCVTGRRYAAHPQGFVFKDFEVPCFDKAVEIVTDAAYKIGNFRLVSWDIAVDSEGDVVLVEANMRKGGIRVHQFDNGPLFGELTKRVMDEVFKKEGARK